MKEITVTLDVTKDFKAAVLAGSDVVFNKTLDGCGAGPDIRDVTGKDQVEFEMWEDGFASLEHWLQEYYPQDVLGITRTP